MKCKLFYFNVVVEQFTDIERKIESWTKDHEVLLVSQSQTDAGQVTVILWYED